MTDRELGHAYRLQLIKKLGGECARCGFSDPRALQVHDKAALPPYLTKDEKRRMGRSEQKRVADGRVRRSGNTRWLYGTLLRELAAGAQLELRCANCNWIALTERREARYGPLPRPKDVA